MGNIFNDLVNKTSFVNVNNTFIGQLGSIELKDGYLIWNALEENSSIAYKYNSNGLASDLFSYESYVVFKSCNDFTSDFVGKTVIAYELPLVSFVTENENKRGFITKNRLMEILEKLNKADDKEMTSSFKK